MDYLHWLDACIYGTDAIENQSQSQAIRPFIGINFQLGHSPSPQKLQPI